MTSDTILRRYDAVVLRRFLEEAGVISVLQRKGFAPVEVLVDGATYALPHAILLGWKAGRRFLLLDACVGEAVVRPDFFRSRGYPIDRPIDLALVHWLREENPTVSFSGERPPLPLQHHPGLGVLRQMFRVVARIAGELEKDGVVSAPKFFHDAVIFFRSRLFLFLDGEEQGRLEALARDLAQLHLGDASLAVASGCVYDEQGTVVRWTPGYQVFPLSAALTAYFHSSQYAGHVQAGLNRCRFTVDLAMMRQSKERLGRAP
jgi:hypothetical protein